jgi:CheY-like chemotaxis protein
MGNILLFEPNKDQVRRLIFLLRLSGHSCTVAYTSDEALNWLRTGQFLESRFELLLLGSQPEPATLELLLKASRAGGEIPVICLRKNPGDPLAGGSAGLVFCQPEALIATLGQWVQNNESFSAGEIPAAD